MAKIPERPEEIFSEFTEDFQKSFGGELQSIILYGSGARGEYVPRRSDLNFLIVLTENGLREIRRAMDLLPKWRKRSVSMPLFFTRSYMQSSLDSFPIEFLNMKEHHRVVYGEDVLEGLEIPREALRLQCERELKGKLLHLRGAYLMTEGKRPILEAVITRALPSFASIFGALLHLKGIPLPKTNQETIERTAAAFGLDQKLFRDLLNIRHGKGRYAAAELMQLTESFIAEVDKLTRTVDQFV